MAHDSKFIQRVNMELGEMIRQALAAMTGSGSDVPRSNRMAVRNPVLALPGWRSLKALLDDHPVVKAALVALLRDLAADSRERAEQCWKKHKAPMAAYWKAVSVYAGHAARALMSNH